MRKKLLAANWKMHKTQGELPGFFDVLRSELRDVKSLPVDVLIAPPFTLLEKARKLAEPMAVKVAAQNAHYEKAGAFTGEVALLMLAEIGISWVIVGHSERRQYFNETDATVAKKTQACLASGVTPIVCVGETKDQRQNGQTEAVLKIQMQPVLEAVTAASDWVIAYEPVWAIGTGLTATKEQAQEAHKYIRGLLRQKHGEAAANKTRILYGGSVKPDNIDELLKQGDIDGGLIGGASLNPQDFARMIKTAISLV